MRVHPEEEAISAWLDGETGPAEAAEIRVHMAECAHCQERLEELAHAGQALSAFRDLRAPLTLRDRLMEDWEGRWGRLNPRRPVGAFVLSFMPVAAVALGFALFTPRFQALLQARPDVRLAQGPEREGTVLPHVPPAIPGNRKKIATLPIPPKEVHGPRVAPPSETSQVPAIPPAHAAVQLASLTADLDREKGSTDRRRGAGHRVRRPRLRRGHPHREAASVPSPAPAEPEGRSDPATEPASSTLEREQVASAAPVMELIVEDSPESLPKPPRQTSCMWESRNEETGVVRGGLLTRNYDPQGQLQSVEVRVPMKNPSEDGTSDENAPKHDSETHETKGDTDEPEDHSAVDLRRYYAGVLRPDHHSHPST